MHRKRHAEVDKQLASLRLSPLRTPVCHVADMSAHSTKVQLSVYMSTILVGTNALIVT